MLAIRALELFLLPPLPLVAAEVVNVERAIRLASFVELALELNQALAASVNREPAEIAHDPAPPEPFRYRASRPAAAEEVGDEIAFVAAGFDDAFENGFGFLSGVAEILSQIRWL